MRRYNLEHSEQVAVMRWAKLSEWRFPDVALLHAVANGGMRHIAVARSMKDEGVKPGVPDLDLPVARGGYFGLRIEMKQSGKRPKSPTAKGPLSDEQVRWIEALRKQGHCVEVCYGSHEAIAVLTEYLEQPRTEVKP